MLLKYTTQILTSAGAAASVHLFPHWAFWPSPPLSPAPLCDSSSKPRSLKHKCSVNELGSKILTLNTKQEKRSECRPPPSSSYSHILQFTTVVYNPKPHHSNPTRIINIFLKIPLKSSKNFSSHYANKQTNSSDHMTSLAEVEIWLH